MADGKYLISLRVRLYAFRKTDTARRSSPHRAVLHIGAFALRRELSREVRLYRVIERLRRRRCGARPDGTGVRPRRR